MNRPMIGRLLLSFAVVATPVVSTLVDLNATHLFNPAWHPHAVFHDALMLLFLAGMAGVGLWLLWRRSAEPAVGLQVAAAVPALFWTPFFYITSALPHSSLDAFADRPAPVVAGITVYPNVVVATVALAVTLVGYLLARQAPRPSAGSAARRTA